ncbi:hypothetical protein D9M68_784720 [compost metagenome]
MGGAGPAVGGEVGDGARQAGDQAVQGQRLQDDASGERQNLGRGHAQQLAQRGAGVLRLLQAFLAGAGVGVARVDDQRADRAAGGQVGLADLHGGGAEAVAREHAGDAGTFGQAEHRQVASVRFADAGLGDADFNAGNRENFGLGGDLQVNGHDFVSW